MKVRLPKHREFVIHLDETKEPRHEECWAKLEQIVKDYTKDENPSSARHLSRTTKKKSRSCRKNTTSPMI